MIGTKHGRTFTGKAFAVALAGSVALAGLLPANVAEAGQRGYYNGSHGHVSSRHKRPRHDSHHQNGQRINGGELIAAGIIGLAVGAIIADATRPRVVYQAPPAPVHIPPQPVYRQPLDTYTPYHGSSPYPDEPRVIRYEDGYGGGHGGYATYEPWTREWEEWCDAKYRSFNASTGTFRGYDGRDHFCVVK